MNHYKYLKEVKGKMCATTLAFGTLDVKKYIALENGKYDFVGTLINLKHRNQQKRYVARVIYGFNPNDGTYENQEVFYGKNSHRDAIRCLIRHHKLILKIN